MATLPLDVIRDRGLKLVPGFPHSMIRGGQRIEKLRIYRQGEEKSRIEIDVPSNLPRLVGVIALAESRPVW